MRLLNTSTLDLCSFQRQPPPYAILSHTWSGDEAPFNLFTQKRRRLLARPLTHARRRRFHKVLGACGVAKAQGYAWIWIDTCCIDKASSAELSEAINSMYLWYQRAEVCYAYLVDVPAVPALAPARGNGSAEQQEQHHLLERRKRLAGSRWFTRGWTLQELIAPANVEFYDASWTLMDSKANPVETLTAITAIPAGLFGEAWHNLCAGGLAQQSLELLSVAQKLSWASGRQTTRQEDLAYCLMGLFGVHMPLLYGEGEEKAFARLQREIALNTNDQSLFAWGGWLDPGADMDERLLCYSLFAPNTACFRGAGELKATSRHSSVLDWTPPFDMLNDGYLRIRMRVCRDEGAKMGGGFADDDHIAFLDCDLRGETEKVVGLFVRRLEDVSGIKRYVRVHRLLGKFSRELALRYESEDVLLGALPRHIPRFEFLGTGRR